ncbi:MAG: outer membrane protein assembly factor BamA [Helicobacter sp.]|nr:outer membrane protein assembly factor BamA [Helicobacter sp.]
MRKSQNIKLKKLKWIFFGILGANLLAAEDIKSINFEGLYYLSPLLANEITNIQVGEKLDNAKLNNAILKLYDQGYFTDIYVTFDNGALVFHFTEKPRISNVELRGYGSEADRSKVIKELPLKKGDVLDDEKLARSEEILSAVVQAQGYYGSTIEIARREISKNVYNIIFNVNRGNDIRITKAIYDGAKNLNKDEVQSLSANKEQEFLGFLWGRNDGKLKIGELDLDGRRIHDVYMRHGYLDADVSSPLLSANFFDYTAQLYYKITEGKRYKISSIQIVQDKEIIPEDELKNALTSKANSFIDIQNVRTDAMILKELIADKGYAFVQIIPDPIKDEKNAEVQLVYRIQTGEKVKIRDVIVTGNTISPDRIVRRQILLSPGDIYSLSEITASENGLRRLGFFQDVKIEQRRISADSMDLVVKVSEGRTGELQFGLGYGASNGLTGNGSVTQRNLFGSGQSGSLSFNVSSGVNLTGTSRQVGRSFNGNLSLSNPRLFDTFYSSNFNLYYNKSVGRTYDSSAYGFGVNFGRQITDSFGIGLGYDLNISEITGFEDPRQARYIYGDQSRVPNSSIFGVWKRDFKTTVASSFTPSFSFDNTDDFYFPKNGVILNGSAQFNGIGGHVYNTKLNTRLSYYKYLEKWTSLDLIFRYKTQAGYILRYNRNNYLPLSSSFYLGGIGSVRGFQNSSISPVDEFGLQVGGDGILTNTIELSYGLLDAARMRVSAFFDWGLLAYKGRSLQANFLDYGLFGKNINFSHTWRASTGLNVEWISPLGPLILVFPLARFNVQKLNPNDPDSPLNDQTSNFEFSIGTRF